MTSAAASPNRNPRGITPTISAERRIDLDASGRPRSDRRRIGPANSRSSASTTRRCRSGPRPRSRSSGRAAAARRTPARVCPVTSTRSICSGSPRPVTLATPFPRARCCRTSGCARDTPRASTRDICRPPPTAVEPGRAGRVVPDGDELVGFGIRQRLQQHAVDDAEHGRRRADADRERRNATIVNDALRTSPRAAWRKSRSHSCPT